MKEVKTTSEKLLKDCDDTIALMTAMKEFISKHAAYLDKFGFNSSASSRTIVDMIFLHEAPEDVKEFCRAVGGEWVRVANSGNGFNYEIKEPFHVIVYDAERPKTERLVL